MKRLRVVVIITVLVLFLAACGGAPSGARPDENGELMVIQIDEEGGMRFEPNEIVLTAGQPVRIILENHGEKDHEFMVGQNVLRTDDGAANGFEIDFFEGIEDLVEVQLGEGAMLMIDDEMVMMDMAMDDDMDMGDEEMDMDEEGDMDMEEDGEMEDEHMEEDMEMGEDEHADGDEHAEGMGHDGWMVMNAAGSGTTIIEFTVPADRVGEWEMGCFEDDGTHYDDGMRGTLVVVAP